MSGVFTIPASAPFLPTLIAALKDGRLVPGFPDKADPLSLSRATLYLPTQRAGVLARAAFLDVLGTDAAVLPHIVPLGEIDEDELAFAGAASGEPLALPQALGALERRMVLARLVLSWIKSPSLRTAIGKPLVANSPASALMLADALARLMDDIITRQVPWDAFDKLVPQDYDEFWQKTLEFLDIARRNWPDFLKERDRIEPAQHRDLLIEAERKRLETHDGPVIAAGSTGSMPATAKLLATIAKLPHGAVVLPGLDTTLDAESWEMIGGEGKDLAPGHPQFAMHALLRRFGLARKDVTELTPSGARERLVSEALRPAAATERWAVGMGEAPRKEALDGITVIEAANAEEEALAIAIVLRKAAEDGRTAALVTPDRALARRVGAALTRWKIVADDSGGDALPDTEAGVFARLAAQAALEGLPPVELLALLKHARFRLGQRIGAHQHAIAALESAVLRGPRPRPGAAGLGDALTSFREELRKLRNGEPTDLYASDPRANLRDADLDAAQALVAELGRAFAPFDGLKGRHSFIAMAKRHQELLAVLTRNESGEETAFAGADGLKLAEAFEDIDGQHPSDDLPMSPSDYSELFEAAIADRVCRRAGTPGARVRILGPLEARLVSVDRVVLGGLTEGVWPPDTRTDPWLSRPMRLDLALDLPERRIGLSAHDFAQLLGTKDCVLTRANKLGGAPTVLSRFVQRLAAVAGESWGEATARGNTYVEWARHLDKPLIGAKPARRPEPRPPRDARPKGLSVTEIEHWLRDPYTIYAKHILRLAPLDAVDTLPGARDRGNVIHGAIGDFTKNFAKALPADPLGELLKLGEKHFEALQDYPEAKAFWWPRFQRIARWFIQWEAGRRAEASALHAEIRAELEIPLGERTFYLRTRADRIEQLASGYAILDYKTGTAPTERQVRTGLSPQLTLEAAILRAGKFENVPGGAITQLAYVSLKGGEPPGKESVIEFKDGNSPDQHAERALGKLTGVAARFEDEQTPYLSLVSPMWKRRYGDYDHLARVKEWSAFGEDDDEELAFR